MVARTSMLFAVPRSCLPVRIARPILSPPPDRAARDRPPRRGGKLPPRLGVADDALDRRPARLEPALDLVDLRVHVVDAERGIDQAVEIHDLARGRLTHADFMDVADWPDLARDIGERGAHRGHALARSIAAALSVGLQRLDVGVDLDLRAELLGNRRFERAGDVVGGAERKLAIDFEIELRDAIER